MDLFTVKIGIFALHLMDRTDRQTDTCTNVGIREQTTQKTN